MFGLFKKKEPAFGQPHPDWPWALTVDANPPIYHFTWEDIVKELHDLNMSDTDSFLILEQKDPKNSENYWFIQSAFALRGPHTGQYVVGVGYGSGDKRALLEQYRTRLEDVIPIFQAAFRRRPLDLSQFEDQSDLLG